jgi:hypothetical protein
LGALGRLQAVQEDLLNILFCYCKNFPELSYRQGMHELAALVYMTLSQDRLEGGADTTAAAGADAAAAADADAAAAAAAPTGNETGDSMQAVCDPKFVAHDVYAVFSVIMKVAGNWFMQNQGPQRRISAQEAALTATPFGCRWHHPTLRLCSDSHSFMFCFVLDGAIAACRSCLHAVGPHHGPSRLLLYRRVTRRSCGVWGVGAMTPTKAPPTLAGVACYVGIGLILTI